MAGASDLHQMSWPLFCVGFVCGNRALQCMEICKELRYNFEDRVSNNLSKWIEFVFNGFLRNFA